MAMPNNAKIFPRSYSGGQSTSSPSYRPRDGDEAMSQIWVDYTSPKNASTQWSFRKRVFPTVLRLLSRRNNWFLYQDLNPVLRDYNYQFIVDTLRFIGTGRRRINIHAWSDLVTNKQADGRFDLNGRHEIADVFEQYSLSGDVPTLIQRWCSHPGGFDDMVITMNILFGDGHIKIDPPSTPIVEK